MPCIYAADTWCDSCGEAIKERLLKDATEEQKADWQDERNYDSDEFPKWMSDDEESDGPQHCGSHGDCLEAEVLPSGHKIGALLSTSLTSHGVEYLKEMAASPASDPEVIAFWKQQFDWVDFGDKEEDETPA